MLDLCSALFSTETPKTAAKRKAEAKKETPPAKKAKADGEGGELRRAVGGNAVSKRG